MMQRSAKRQQQGHKQQRPRGHEQQKQRARDAGKRRNASDASTPVEVDEEVLLARGEWPLRYAPSTRMWQAFFSQSDPSRRQVRSLTPHSHSALVVPDVVMVVLVVLVALVLVVLVMVVVVGCVVQAAVEGLIDVLLREEPVQRLNMWTQEVTPPVMTHPIYDRWLASDGVEADERVCDLRRWIAAQLRPVMAPPSPPQPTAVSPQPQEPLPQPADDDQDDEDDGDEVECDDDEESREDDEEEKEESEPDDTTSKDEEADQRHGQENKRGAKKGSAKRRDDPEWQVQMAALRLASALMVLCTDEHAHVLLDSSATTAGSSSSSPGSAARSHSSSGSKRTSNKSGSGAAHAEAAAGMLDVLHRVLAFPAARNSEHAHDPELEFKRSRLRVEAMNSLAVACFVVDDAKLTRDTCATIAKLYLDDIRPPHAVEDRHLWDADADDEDDESDDDGDEADAGADEDDEDEEDSSDDSTGAESDDGSYDGVSEQAASAKQDGLKRRDAECAAALNVLVFLLGLDESDDEVRKFIASHTEALISLFFAKNSSDIVGSSLHTHTPPHTHERTRTRTRTHTTTQLASVSLADCFLPHTRSGSSKVRMNAARLLAILYRASATDDENDDTDEDDDDDGEDDEPETDDGEEVGEMSREGRRRFLALCQTRAANRGATGRRTRGRVARKSERREAAFFRDLWADLHAHDYRRTHASMNADARAEAALSNERVRRERYAVMSRTEVKIEGWRWDVRLEFLRQYFHQYFTGLFEVHISQPNSLALSAVNLVVTVMYAHTASVRACVV
jgi:hypothetical protein